MSSTMTCLQQTYGSSLYIHVLALKNCCQISNKKLKKGYQGMTVVSAHVVNYIIFQSLEKL